MNRPDEASLRTVFRRESGRAIAGLARRFGDLDLAEDAVQDAFVIALERWAVDGLPPNPGGWIVTTARRSIVDRLRREGKRRDRHGESLQRFPMSTPMPPDQSLPDDLLRLVFTCCHPALAVENQVALTLRLACGLEVSEIARAFLIPEATVAQRLVRSKRKIRMATIPFGVPDPTMIAARLPPVLAVLYLVFNEGYVATSGADLLQRALCTEALRLTRLVVQVLDTPESVGLLALMLLIDARRSARTNRYDLVPLAAQDRRRWNRDQIARGHSLVRACLERNQPGPYQIQAAIQAVHTDVGSPAHTDWHQILALYDQLRAFGDSPIVALNRAVAVGEVHGPQAALDALDPLDAAKNHLYHAIRGAMLARLGRIDEARDAWSTAAALTDNEVERRHALAQKEALG